VTQTADLPRIAVFSLGGTIAMTGSGKGVLPTLAAADLITGVPGLDGIAWLEARALRAAPSIDLNFADLAEVAAAIRAAFADGVQGVVVTQGTDTLEEAAFLLDLLLEAGPPVVVTGALRNPTLAGADGPANLLAAVRVAASPDAAGLGVVVVANDEIHAARYVRKTHIFQPSSFGSPTVGPLGWIVEDRVRIALRPATPTPTFALTGAAPFVPLITVGFSMDARELAALDAPGLAGAVIAGAGSGHVPSHLVPALEVAAERVPVVLASRVGAGETYRKTYAYAGGEIDLTNRRLILSGHLDGYKARILLSVLLAQGADRSDVSAAFAEF
jgi:L-asparaginase